MFQVQVYRKWRLPARRAQEVAPLRRHPDQAIPLDPSQSARASIPPEPPLLRHVIQGRHLTQGLAAQQDTLSSIAATSPNSFMVGFSAIFIFLKTRQGTSSHSRLERLVTFLLKERPPFLICLKTPESHIRFLWLIQYIILSSAQLTSEDGKVFAFARDVRLGKLLATAEIAPEWL